MLKVENLCVSVGQKEILKNLSLQVREKEWWMICGPNGAGKSTLLRALSGALPYTGSIAFQGKNRNEYKPREWARVAGMLTQRNHADYAFTVEETVRMGRYAHIAGIFQRKDAEGEQKVQDALKMTGLSSLSGRSLLSLSGGELQRVFLAQVFAQEPKLLMLDEPANHLDLPYQKQLFSLIEEWLKTEGRAVITVVHDLNLAKAFGTHALLLQDGTAIEAGPKQLVMTKENLREGYGMDVYGWMRELTQNWM